MPYYTFSGDLPPSAILPVVKQQASLREKQSGSEWKPVKPSKCSHNYCYQ